MANLKRCGRGKASFLLACCFLVALGKCAAVCPNDIFVKLDFGGSLNAPKTSQYYIVEGEC
jgi:hypothetical protein